MTGLRWAPSFTIYGALPFIYGTLLTSAIAMLIAVPVAVLIALLITEILPPRARSTVAVTVDLLAAIPSVVYGLWGLLVLVPVPASVRAGRGRHGRERSSRSWPARRPGRATSRPAWSSRS